MTRYPRVLIVGTVPYNPEESSRALDTYFHNWPKENLRMIFSNTNIPMKGHCGSLFQITDHDVLKVFRRKSAECGRIFNYESLIGSQIKKEDPLKKYKKKTCLRFYARKMLWNKKRWLTQKLIDWVDEFKPEAIYICFSDDYFILDIAEYFIGKYNIPVIAQIGDDYFFKKYPLIMKPYLRKYKKLFLKIMNYSGFGVYISQKLADKYNSFFKLQGYPFYLSSNVKTGEKDINYAFNYIGKIGAGRDKSLMLLGDVLNKINPEFVVTIYSQDKVSNKIRKAFTRHNCIFKGPIKYDDALKMMQLGSFNIVASGFSKKNINDTRYSLSTKVADSLASPGPIIVVGDDGDGAVDFFKDKNCSIFINSKKPNLKEISAQFLDKKLLYKKIEEAHKLFNELFITSENRMKFETLCRKIVCGKDE